MGLTITRQALCNIGAGFEMTNDLDARFITVLSVMGITSDVSQSAQTTV
jgi:hypothetical protein